MRQQRNSTIHSVLFEGRKQHSIKCNKNAVQGVETSNALDGAATMGAGDGHGDAFQMDLRYGAEAAQVNSTKQSLRGLTIQNLLVQCYHGNFLKHSNWSYSAKLALPPTVASGDQSTARYVLELCQYVMDAQEQQDFQMKSFATDEQLQTAADTIQQRAFRKMFQFEGDDPKTEEQLLKKKGSQGKKPTVSGVGSRVRKYKAKYNLKELQEKPETEIAAAGTPPDNRSMLKYMVKSNARSVGNDGNVSGEQD